MHKSLWGFVTQKHQGEDNIFLSDPLRRLGLRYAAPAPCPELPGRAKYHNQNQLDRLETPNYVPSHQTSSPVKALPSTAQETSFHPS